MKRVSNKKESAAVAASPANKLARGIYNNNPLNIRKSNWNWKGKKRNGSDPAFEQFIATCYGLRAAIIILTRYVTGTSNVNPGAAKTVEDIIHRWAPNGDGANNERAYVDFVIQRAGFSTNEVVPDTIWLFRLLNAMCYMESNYVLTDSMFYLGYSMVPPFVKDFWGEYKMKY